MPGASVAVPRSIASASSTRSGCRRDCPAASTCCLGQRTRASRSPSRPPARSRAAARTSGFCFNRKEAKDHGEGGVLVGHRLADGDRVVIIEDVTTAGTSVRETVPILRAAAKIRLVGLIVAVDRQERGQDERGALRRARRGVSADTAVDRQHRPDRGRAARAERGALAAHPGARARDRRVPQQVRRPLSTSRATWQLRFVPRAS